MKANQFFVAFAFAAIICSCDSPLNYVNPFVGTSFTGHTFPNAAYPFGMVQPGPETGWNTWDYCSGYRYNDSLILGFSQDRISGTGCPDLGDVRVMPFSSSVREDFSSAFDKSSEIAEPGFYGVNLKDNFVKVGITCSEHVAIYRFDYEKSMRNVFLDFSRMIGWNNKVLSSNVKVVGSNSLEGSSRLKGWVNRTIFYYITFSEDFEKAEVSYPGDVKEEGQPCQYVLNFKPSNKNLYMKVSLSTVSVEGAKKNMQAEVPFWNFNGVLKSAQRAWREYLGVAEIQGSPEQKMNFYTSLYHLFLQPNNIADVDGAYNGADYKLHDAASGKHYSTLSQWDTFRAANPFYSIFLPEKAADIVNSMIRQCDEIGHLPIWALCGKDNYCMIANHSVPVVAEAVLNGLPGIDAEKAYSAIKRSLTVSHRKSSWEIYDQYGYLPFDLVPTESVSRTLEMGYDDYCAARLAERLGKAEDAAFFDRRAGYYKNLYDPSTRLMRGKDTKGEWREPFARFAYSHSATIGGDYTEGNAWQYCWHVLQDVPGLVNLMGGNERFVEKLDSLFILHPDESETGHVLDVTGLIGQYVHGNEPCHHIPYLYALAGRPDRTQEVVRDVFDQFYIPKVDGLCGNDDCGQMSAWYVFSACGFYPVNPVSGEFVLGAPQIPEAKLRLPDGKTLTMVAENLSEANKYVKNVTYNGSELRGIITRSQILDGGVLKFTMTDVKPTGK